MKRRKTTPNKVNSDNRDLIKTIKRVYERDDIYLEIQDLDFMLTKEEISQLVWQEWNNEVFFHACDVARILGKYQTDYAANWVYHKKERKFFHEYGFHCKVEQLEDKEAYTQRFLELYPEYKRLSKKTWLINWARFYEYVSRARKELLPSEKEKEPIGVVIHEEVLYVSSRMISFQLKVDHDSVLALIYKYQERLEELGPLEIRKIGAALRYKVTDRTFLLNEDQAYFLGTLTKNTESSVLFKQWLVQQFSKARKIIKIHEEARDDEEILHRQLCELATYSNIKVHSEYPLRLLDATKEDPLYGKVKRIDILLNDQVGIELKKDRIGESMLLDILGNRGYYHSLNLLPEFKYLILCSPAGISPNAQRMIDLMKPRVVFMLPQQIGDYLGEMIVEQYPEKMQWWLKKVLFPKFTRVLSPEFLKKYKYQ